jgi:hypothetical protein
MRTCNFKTELDVIKQSAEQTESCLSITLLAYVREVHGGDAGDRNRVAVSSHMP